MQSNTWSHKLIFGELDSFTHYVYVKFSTKYCRSTGLGIVLIYNFVEFRLCLQVDNKGISIVMLVPVVLGIWQYQEGHVLCR